MNGWRSIMDLDFPESGQRVLVWDSSTGKWNQARFHGESKRFRVGSIQQLFQYEWWHPGPESGPQGQTSNTRSAA